MYLHYSVKFTHLGLDKYKQYLITLYHLKCIIISETMAYPYIPEVS